MQERNTSLIHNFLNTGSVNESTSLFHYDTGYTHGYFSHPDFVPFFIDEFTEEERNASIVACGGASASQACIFDFLATGDKALADSSGSEQSTFDTESATAGEKRLFLFLNIFLSNNLSATVYFSQRMMYNYHNLKNILLENETPFIELEGDGQILVEVNKSVELKFNASDDEAFSYQVLQQPSTGFSFNDSNGVAIWTPPDSSVVNIRYSQINVFCGDPIQCS